MYVKMQLKTLENEYKRQLRSPDLIRRSPTKGRKGRYKEEWKTLLERTEEELFAEDVSSGKF